MIHPQLVTIAILPQLTPWMRFQEWLSKLAWSIVVKAAYFVLGVGVGLVLVN